MNPRNAVFVGTVLRKGLLAMVLVPMSLGFSWTSHGAMSVVIGAHAAESGQGSHEKGGSHGSGEGEGGSHGSGVTHGSRKGGEKGYGHGTSRGYGGTGLGIGDTIFRSGHGRGATASSGKEKSGTVPHTGAHRGGKGGAGGLTASSTKKGAIYGNLWVILRDPITGAPVLDENGHVQPVLANGVVVQLTPEGEVPAAYSDQVQTVEFSRLNVSRSPSHVIEKALQEAQGNMASADEITHDDAGRLVVIKDGTAKTIDSPLQNLALYVDAIRHGTFSAQQAASFLGAAADKAQPITLDIVVYLNTIVGLNGSTGTNYVNYTHFTYDRASAYPGNVTYLVPEGNGTFRTEVEPVIEAVFHNKNLEETGAGAFAQAADDARAVIQFIHDHGGSD